MLGGHARVRHAVPPAHQKGSRLSVGWALLALLWSSDLIRFERAVSVHRALSLSSVDVLSTMHKEMQAESAALFKRTHNLESADIPVQHADRTQMVATPWLLHGAMSTHGHQSAFKVTAVSAVAAAQEVSLHVAAVRKGTLPIRAVPIRRVK